MLEMYLCRFKTPGGTRVGGVVGDLLYDLTLCRAKMLAEEGKASAPLRLANSEVPTDMTAFISGGKQTLEKARRSVEYVRENKLTKGPKGPDDKDLYYPFEAAKLRIPTSPPNIWCMGLVYDTHIEGRGDFEVPEEPRIFPKPSRLFAHPEEPVMIPKRFPDKVLYGTELTLVFGKGGKNISEADAFDYVYGYTIFNDLTVSGLPSPKCKLFDTFAPIGPWIVPKDQIEDPQDLDISLRVNGNEVQSASTSEMLFPIERHIQVLTSQCTIHTGDLLSTGDVGTGQPLTPGDVMEAEVEGVGILTNPARLEE